MKNGFYSKSNNAIEENERIIFKTKFEQIVDRWNDAVLKPTYCYSTYNAIDEVINNMDLHIFVKLERDEWTDWTTCERKKRLM